MVGHLFGWGAFVSSALVTSNLTSHMLLFTSARHRHSDVPSCLEYQQIENIEKLSHQMPKSVSDKSYLQSVFPQRKKHSA